MEGQFLVRQIYEDEITYNLIGAAANKLSKYLVSHLTNTSLSPQLIRSHFSLKISSFMFYKHLNHFIHL